MWFDLASHTLMIYYGKSLIQVANESQNKEQVASSEHEIELSQSTHRLMKEGKKKNACCCEPLRCEDCLLPIIITAVADSF